MTITPTVGRVVWIRRANRPVEAGIIASVHGDRLINVAGFDANGVPFQLTSLILRQPEDEAPEYDFAEWMPYQTGQAAKTEALEAKLAAGENDMPWPSGEQIDGLKFELSTIGIRVPGRSAAFFQAAVRKWLHLIGAAKGL